MAEHILSWFEVPVSNFERSKKFYEAVLGTAMDTETLDGFQMAYFPFFNGRPTGCITKAPGNEPNETGTLIYLNGNPDLSTMLDRVQLAGGKVLQPKTLISPEYGYYAHFMDTEGNKIGLTSEK